MNTRKKLKTESSNLPSKKTTPSESTASAKPGTSASKSKYYCKTD